MNCGIEIDTEWDEAINLGRKKVYLCRKCKVTGENCLKDSKINLTEKWKRREGYE